jgi:glucose-6-phosphate dehydrogenase assembly protein OpcA
MEANLMHAEPAAVRVATMNFVVFVDDPGHREWVLERAQRVAAKHPCRLVVLDATGTTTGVAIAGGRHDVGVMALDAAGILSLAKEHTVGDVPTVLWWNGTELLGSETFAQLAGIAQTVVVDSSGLERSEARIKDLGEFLTGHPTVVLHDLAFMRLGPWMDMIAQFFDDPALREDLFSINSLRIESGSDAEACYLAGWLGSRLSWQPVDANAFRARDGRPVSLRHEIKGDVRRVLSVVLTSDDSTYTAALSDDPNTVCLCVDGARAKATRCAPLQNVDNVSLIERALLKNAHDRIFETSLQTVRELLC